MKTALLDPSQIVVEHDRPINKKFMQFITNSVRSGGIHDPLICMEEGGKVILIKGLTRLRVAQSLGIKVPVVFDQPPKNVDGATYRAKIRLVLDIHRQDLTPSQRADLILLLQAQFGLNNAAVARYLGRDEDTIRFWLAARHYIPEVTQAMDTGGLTMLAARTFDGMTAEAQRMVWKKHREDLLSENSRAVRKRLRALYSAEDHPELYTNPATARKKEGAVSKLKKATKAKADGEAVRAKKKTERLEAELEAGQRELRQIEAEIRASIPVFLAIERDSALKSAMPPEMTPEVERFLEIYG